MKKLIALVAASLSLVACGGAIEEDTQLQSQEPGQTEQAVRPTCPAGYTSSAIWECEATPACRGKQGNVLYLYCTSPSGEQYNAGPTGTTSCGACY